MAQLTKNYVCRTLYLRNHITCDCHLWYTCVNDDIRRCFFYFFKILIFRVVRGWRCKKWSKMTKTSVHRTQYPRNHTSYDHLSCTYVKWYLQVVFFLHFFKSLIFQVVRGEGGHKRTKNSPKWQKISLLHSISHEPYSFLCMIIICGTQM